jgi:hypothetical protein
MPSTSFRYVPNPRAFQEFARSPAVENLVKDAADRGAAAARAIAPKFTGLTYTGGRKAEYVKSIYSAATMRPSGWRAEFGATAPWTLQVEFGSGRPATGRNRPQTGRSPKTRTLGRALDTLRSA